MRENPRFSAGTEYEETERISNSEGGVLISKTVGVRDEAGSDRLKVQFMGGGDSTVDDIYMNVTWVPHVSKQEFFAGAEKFIDTLEQIGIKGDEQAGWSLTVPHDDSLVQPTKTGLLFEADTLDTPYGSFSHHGNQVDFETFRRLHIPEPLSEFIVATMDKPLHKAFIKKQLEKSPFK